MAEKGLVSRRAMILTAIPVEYQAVRAHLINIHEEYHPQGTVYERGTFPGTDQPWDITIAEIGAGNATAALEAERAINHLKPDIILFVGVAGGCKEVKLGDVVAATKVYWYESGKAERVFLPRPSMGHSAYRLVQRAQAEARKSDWLQRLKGPFPTQTPIVYVAPIAAGEKVVASTRSDIAEFLRANYGDALAVEMEGYGVLTAAHANPQVAALVIRGISDLLDNKPEADAANFQLLAAQHASAFAFEILAKFANDQQTADIPRRSRGKAPPSVILTHSPRRTSPKQRSTQLLKGNLVLLIALVFLLLIGTVGGISWYTAISHTNAIAQQATATASAKIGATTTARAGPTATITAALSPYEKAITTNGIMFGFDAQHTHMNPYERLVSPSNVSQLVLGWIGATGQRITDGGVLVSSPIVVDIYHGSKYPCLTCCCQRDGLCDVL